MSEDDPAFYWEMMCKNLARENSRLLDQLCEADEKIAELESENAKLRDQLRWRKWPEEKPEAEQQCQLILANKLAPILCCSKYPFDHWENLNATHWRPIGPLPKEVSDE